MKDERFTCETIQAAALGRGIIIVCVPVIFLPEAFENLFHLRIPRLFVAIRKFASPSPSASDINMWLCSCPVLAFIYAGGTICWAIDGIYPLFPMYPFGMGRSDPGALCL